MKGVGFERYLDGERDKQETGWPSLQEPGQADTPSARSCSPAPPQEHSGLKAAGERSLFWQPLMTRAASHLCLCHTAHGQCGRGVGSKHRSGSQGLPLPLPLTLTPCCGLGQVTKHLSVPQFPLCKVRTRILTCLSGGGGMDSSPGAQEACSIHEQGYPWPLTVQPHLEKLLWEWPGASARHSPLPNRLHRLSPH